MNAKMQQAIQATRSGNTQEAQLLLTSLLKENPQNAQAWFLLSHLVDSESKQVVYLSKVLSLDPTHEKAKQRLARLKSAVSTPVPPVVPMQITPAAEKTPSAIVEEAKTVIQPIKPAVPPPYTPPIKTTEAEKPVPVIPPAPPPKAMVSTTAKPQPPLSKKALAAEAARKKQKRQYDMMMGFLGFVAVIILIVFIWVLIS